MDITLRSAGEQAAAIAAKKISARELLDAVIARYKRHNPTINAVVFTQLDEAVALAEQADGWRWIAGSTPRCTDDDQGGLGLDWVAIDFGTSGADRLAAGEKL